MDDPATLLVLRDLGVATLGQLQLLTMQQLLDAGFNRVQVTISLRPFNLQRPNL